MTAEDANHLLDALLDPGRGHDAAPFARTPDGRTWTHADLRDAAGRVAGALAGAGVRPGDRVAAQVGKSLEAIALYLGCVRAGAAFLPLNPDDTDAEVAYFLGDAEPAALVCDPARRAGLEGTARAAVLTLAADGTGTLTEATAAALPLPRAVPRGPDDLAAILYTSGTTGRAKGAMLTHGNLASNARTLRDAWRFAPDDVLIHALPLFHTHGLFVAINVTLAAGASLRLLPRFDADAVLAAMDGASVLMGVPTFYTRLLAHPGLTRARAGRMRLFVSGSAPLPARTHRLWQARTGHAILERYGMTETSMSTSNPHDGERRAGTVGLPLPGIEVRVTDGEGRALPPGETGGIEVRGPNVFAGYWRRPDKTAEDMRPGGWFATGDLGAIDADGYLGIVGRAKDLVITGGLNVYPSEVEALIDAIPGVAESAVIGLPHPDLGEAVAAVVVPSPGATLSAEAVLAALEGTLARYKRPRRVVLAPELPRNAMGKVQKAALRQAHAGAFDA